MKNLILVIIILFAFSCNSETISEYIDVNGEQVLVCNLMEVTDTINFPLSDLVESCQIVRLKTDKGGLFDRAWHTSISENYIAIKSYGKFPVKLFDRYGSFIRNIGAIGAGPGEYNSLYGIQLDEAQNRIYLTPFANAKKIIVYSLDGQLLEDIPLAYRSGKIRAFVDGEIVNVVCMPIGNSKVSAFQQKLDGTVIISVPASKYLYAPEFSHEIFSYNNSDNFEFHNTMTDTLYQFSPPDSILHPKFILKKPADQNIYSSLYSLPHHYYAWIQKNKRLLIDKKTGKSYYIKLKNDFFGSFEADIWGGLNGYFINVIPAIVLKDKIADALKNKHLSEKDRELLHKIDNETDQEDNPIVFFGKYKR